MRSGLPLYRKVLDHIRTEIHSGTLAVGAALPTERELGDKFTVSRITVRRAMDELAQEGLISRGSGKAARVAAPKLVHALATLEDPLDTLRIVKDTVVRLCAFEWCFAAGGTARALGLDDGDQMLRIERLRSRGGTAVLHTTVFLPASVGALLSRKALDHSALHDVLTAAGYTPVAVERQMTAAPCPRPVAKLMGIGPGSPVFRVARITRDIEGRPLHLLIGHWRWDRFSLRLVADGSSREGLVTVAENEMSDDEVIPGL